MASTGTLVFCVIVISRVAKDYSWIFIPKITTELIPFSAALMQIMDALVAQLKIP